jgi:hypothetical protein
MKPVKMHWFEFVYVYGEVHTHCPRESYIQFYKHLQPPLKNILRGGQVMQCVTDGPEHVKQVL